MAPLGSLREPRETTSAEAHPESFDFAQDYQLTHSSTGRARGFLRRRVKSRKDKIDYIRGYFDTEGGIAKNPSVRYYLYFAQKNKSDLSKVKGYIEELGVVCGRTHNPSKNIDPNYWRFFIKARSYLDFAKLIGSGHPEKRQYLRMKI